MSSFEELEKEIENVQDAFYSDSGKKTFFKKQQKFNCAKQVASQIPMEMLLSQTCWIHPTMNYVQIHYPILKTYASPEIFESISNHIVSVCFEAKQQYGGFVVVLNLDEFTISAAERYKELIDIFCNKCFRENLHFSEALVKFVIYNTPITIDAIKPMLIPFIMEEVRPKIALISKTDSKQFLATAGLTL